MTTLAVFGAGRIGRVHALNAAAHPDLEVRFLVDPVASPERDALAARIGATVATPEAVLADPAIDGIVIASPTDAHAGQMLAAAKVGKAIFCEKPVSLEFRTAGEVCAAVAASRVPCMIGFQRRYDPSFRALRERIVGGAAGRLEHIVSHTRDPAPPPVSYVERSGGLFRDQAIHDFDMARYLLGEEIRTVYATGACLIDPAIGRAGDIDTAMVTLTSVSGRFVQLVNCRRGPFGYDQRLEALCEREVLYVQNQPRSEFAVANASGFTSAPPQNFFMERFAEAYRLEMAAFLALIRDGTPPLAGLSEGLEAQRLAEAALASMQRGVPVHIDASWTPDRA